MYVVYISVTHHVWISMHTNQVLWIRNYLNMTVLSKYSMHNIIVPSTIFMHTSSYYTFDVVYFLMYSYYQLVIIIYYAYVCIRVVHLIATLASSSTSILCIICIHVRFRIVSTKPVVRRRLSFFRLNLIHGLHIQLYIYEQTF